MRWLDGDANNYADAVTFAHNRGNGGSIGLYGVDIEYLKKFNFPKSIFGQRDSLGVFGRIRENLNYYLLRLLYLRIHSYSSNTSRSFRVFRFDSASLKMSSSRVLSPDAVSASTESANEPRNRMIGRSRRRSKRSRIEWARKAKKETMAVQVNIMSVVK